jgi:hypothetical protein
MANFTDPTQQLAEQKEAAGLPAEFQGQLNQALLRQALAQALLQRGMQVPEGQTIQTGAGAPNRYVKPSPFQYLASIANLGAGASGLGQAQSDIMGTMQRFQGAQQQSTANLQNQALVNIGAAPGTDPSSLPGNLSARYYANLAQLEQQSIFPEARANSIKHAQIAAELGKEQISQQGQTGRQAQGAVLAGSSPQSINEAYRLTPFGQPLTAGGGGGLQPNNPQPSVVGGHLAAPQAETGNLEFGPFTQGSVLAQRQQDQQRESFDKQGQALLEDKGQVIHVLNAGEKAKAILELASDPRTIQGIHDPMAVGNLQKYAAFFGGRPPPQGTTNLDVLRQLTTQMIGDATAGAGVKGSVRSVKEWQQILSTLGPELTPEAARTHALNVLREANAIKGSYDRRSAAYLPRARQYGISGAYENQLDIKPEDIAHVGSGLPEGTLDLRGLIPKPQ